MSRLSKIAVFILVLLVAACASSQPKATVNVPDKLRAGADQSLAMIVPARGVQIYECRASKKQVGVYEWTFVAPEADLFDTRGNRIGRHYAGPHWESTDGSKILGTVKESTEAPGRHPESTLCAHVSTDSKEMKDASLHGPSRRSRCYGRSRC